MYIIPHHVKRGDVQLPNLFTNNNDQLGEMWLAFYSCTPFKQLVNLAIPRKSLEYVSWTRVYY